MRKRGLFTMTEKRFENLVRILQELEFIRKIFIFNQASIMPFHRDVHLCVKESNETKLILQHLDLSETRFNGNC